MTRQLSLFPDSPLNISKNLKDEKLTDFETIFNPVFSLNAVLQSVGYLEDMGKSRWKEPRRRRRP